MIHPKDCSSPPSFALCFGSTLVPKSPSSEEKTSTSPPPCDHDGVLQDLFRARSCSAQQPQLQQQQHQQQHCSNERPRRLIAPMPLLAISSLKSLVAQRSTHHPTSSSYNNNNSNSSSNHETVSDCPFPSSSLFDHNSSSSSSSSSSSLTGDAELDRSIRSLSQSGLLSNSISHHNRKRRRRAPRNFATRHRLLGQVLGKKGVQQALTTIQQVQRLQAELRSQQSHGTTTTSTSANSCSTLHCQAVQDLLHDTVLVDAWENTPLDDWKSVSWEELLQTARKHLRAYQDFRNIKEEDERSGETKKVTNTSNQDDNY